MIVDPYRLYDCSRESDGAAAVIVMSAEEARARARKPVYLLGIARGAPYRGGDAVENFGEHSLSGFSSVAKRLWAQSGVRPAVVDFVQVYENFSPAGVGALMEHGFFTPDNVADVMTVENLTSPNGGLPVNTSGGCLAEGFIHGMEIVFEGVRQIRGDSPNPVPGARVCRVTGGPASTYVSSALFGAESVL